MSPKDLETALSLRRTKKIELFPKVILQSIERNSIRSKRSYSSGLTLLQNFLKAKEQQIKYEGCYNCETVLQLRLLEQAYKGGKQKSNVEQQYDARRQPSNHMIDSTTASIRKQSGDSLHDG